MKIQYKSYIPQCTTQAEYRRWKASGAYAAYNFCTDCTPEYKEKMLKEGRCERPDIVFRTDRDGFLYGRPSTVKDEEDEELIGEAA